MLGESRGLHVLWSSLALQALPWNIPDHHVSIILCLNLHPLCRHCEHGCLDRIHIVTSRNAFLPYHLVSSTAASVSSPGISSVSKAGSTSCTSMVLPFGVNTHTPWTLRVRYPDCLRNACAQARQ